MAKKRKVLVPPNPEIATETDIQIYVNETGAIRRKIERLRKLLLQHEEETESMQLDLVAAKEENDNEIKQLRQEVKETKLLKLQRRQEKHLLEVAVKEDVLTFEEKLKTIEKEKTETVLKLSKEIQSLQEKVSTLKDFKKNKLQMRQTIKKGYASLQKKKEQHMKSVEELKRQRGAGCQEVKLLAEQRILELENDLNELRRQCAMESNPELLLKNQFLTDIISHMKHKIKKCQAKVFKQQIKMDFLRSKRNMGKLEIDYLIKMYLDKCARCDELRIVEDVEKCTGETIAKMSAKESTKHSEPNIVENEHSVTHDKDDSLFIEYVETQNTKLEYLLLSIINTMKPLIAEALAINVVPAGLLTEESKLNDLEILNRYKKRRESAFSRKGDILEIMLNVVSHGLESIITHKTSAETENSHETESVSKSIVEAGQEDINAEELQVPTKIFSSSTSSSLARSSSSSYVVPESSDNLAIHSLLSPLDLNELLKDSGLLLPGEDDNQSITE